MHHTQPRSLPERIYEPNIIHNPTTWFGIWTPHGWRVHRKRWGKAQRCTLELSGDGRTTFFPEALLDPKSRRVEWQDDLHVKDDDLTDVGVYPCDPRIEYPVGRPRWAISHTLLCYPVADHNLYTHEYTWDMTHGHLQTHFHRHVELEKCQTDAGDGRTVRVHHTPISQTIEGNVHYPTPNSAVRGVWDNPGKTGRNYYTRRITQRFAMHNAVYGIPPLAPVVQCHGLWMVLPTDPPANELFDSDTGIARDCQRLIEQLHIPLDEPKIGLILPPYHWIDSKVYEGKALMISRPEGTVGEDHLEQLRQRIGARYEIGMVGYGSHAQKNADLNFYRGYEPMFDLDDNGVIDADDEHRLCKHLGRAVRYNVYHHAYFGGAWLSTGVCLSPEHDTGVPVIADYTHGGGYDAVSGTIHLLDTPGPQKTVYVEYHHDTPAEAGEDNIRIHLYRETP